MQPKRNVDQQSGVGRSLDSRQEIRNQFARRLAALLQDRGWTQSEMARRVEQHLAPGTPRFGRDVASNLLRGVTLPNSSHLDALSKIFGIPKSELLPTRSPNSPLPPQPPAAMDRPANEDGPADGTMIVKQEGDNMARLIVNKAVPWNTAIKILELLKGD